MSTTVFNKFLQDLRIRMISWLDVVVDQPAGKGSENTSTNGLHLPITQTRCVPVRSYAKLMGTGSRLRLFSQITAKHFRFPLSFVTFINTTQAESITTTYENVF